MRQRVSPFLISFNNISMTFSDYFDGVWSVIRRQASLGRLIVLFLALFLGSFLTALQLTLLAILVVCLVRKHRQLRRAGYASILPRSIQELLLRRSIFDVLCDIYFMKRVSRLLKAILAPLLSSMPPSQAHKPFLELQPTFEEAIFTKGIGNISSTFSRLLLPEEPELRQQYLAENGLSANGKEYVWDKSELYYQNEIIKLKRKEVYRNESMVKVPPPHPFESIHVLLQEPYMMKLCSGSSIVGGAVVAAGLLMVAKRLHPRAVAGPALLLSGGGAFLVVGVVVAMYLRLRQRDRQLRIQHFLKSITI